MISSKRCRWAGGVAEQGLRLEGIAVFAESKQPSAVSLFTRRSTTNSAIPSAEMNIQHSENLVFLFQSQYTCTVVVEAISCHPNIKKRLEYLDGPGYFAQPKMLGPRVGSGECQRTSIIQNSSGMVVSWSWSTELGPYSVNMIRCDSLP